MIALDTETTGLLRPRATELHLQPFIIEICAIKFDDSYEVLDKFVSFVKPPVPIPDEVIQITNITNSMVANAPAFPLIYEDLCEFFLGEDTMFAHNCSFDARMILHELERMECQYKFPWPSNQICTVESSTPIQNKRLKLDTLYKIATGRERHRQSHRAEDDVLDMIECIQFLKEHDFI